MTVAIRRARWEDVPVVLGLERSIAELPHWTVAEYERYLGDGAAKARVLLVAEVEGGDGVCGFAAAALAPMDPRIAELESVAVSPAMRRRGVARELCGEAMRWAWGQGAETMELEVRSRSTGALVLYGSLGFSRMGERRGYYADPCDDALLLRRARGSEASHL